MVAAAILSATSCACVHACMCVVYACVLAFKLERTHVDKTTSRDRQRGKDPYNTASI